VQKQPWAHTQAHHLLHPARRADSSVRACNATLGPFGRVPSPLPPPPRVTFEPPTSPAPLPAPSSSRWPASEAGWLMSHGKESELTCTARRHKTFAGKRSASGHARRGQGLQVPKSAATSGHALCLFDLDLGVFPRKKQSLRGAGRPLTAAGSQEAQRSSYRSAYHSQSFNPTPTRTRWVARPVLGVCGPLNGTCHWMSILASTEHKQSLCLRGWLCMTTCTPTCATCLHRSTFNRNLFGRVERN
jgi:hypothetical protein